MSGELPAARPVWFGSPDRPRLGWLDTPVDGRVRGGIVICPPVGLELSHSHYTLRCLARELRDAGFAVLRFDYDGTGQSAGELNDPDRIAAWTQSIRDAVGVLRGLGVRSLGAVGLRLGATLLATVIADDDDLLDGVVLWDPCIGGKAFVREQRGLFRAVRASAAAPRDAAPAQPDAASGLEILGYRLEDELLADLRAFEMPALDELAGERVLVIANPAQTGGDELERRLPEPVVRWRRHAGEETPFDTSELSFAPPRTRFAEIVQWLDAACGADCAPLDSAAPATATAVVARTERGDAIIETVIELGEHRLAAIACEPETGVSGPTVLLVGTGAESSIGPVRQWVTDARRWAAAGVRSVRIDLSGLGESPIRPDLPERTMYAHEHVEEIISAAAAVSPGEPCDVVLVGVCSGAYQALAAGPRVRPRGVVAINPVLTFVMSDRPASAPTAGTSVLMGGMWEEPPPATGAQRLRHAVGARIPRSLWSLIYAAGFGSSPAARLRPLARAGVSTLLMLGANEAEVPLRRTPGALRRLASTGTGEVLIRPGLDHTLRDAASRAEYAVAVDRFLAGVRGGPLDASLAPAPAPPEPVGRTRG